jgi:hypothetical protein
MSRKSFLNCSLVPRIAPHKSLERDLKVRWEPLKIRKSMLDKIQALAGAAALGVVAWTV